MIIESVAAYSLAVVAFPFAVSFTLTAALIVMYLGIRGRDVLRYLRSNLGAPFVIAFVALLLAAAVEFSVGMTSQANTLAEYAYFCILIGVVLQAVSIKLEGGSGEG